MPIEKRVHQVGPSKEVQVLSQWAFGCKKVARIEVLDEAISEKIRIRISDTQFTLRKWHNDLCFLVILQQFSEFVRNVRVFAHQDTAYTFYAQSLVL